ncbi:MAG TPA: Ppx/GppA phosphatase family protein [Chthonomonadaceae bacterium]|nr:Ppx/GppA phosphatase family protein [Chthonomonadaceae bacterium]
MATARYASIDIGTNSVKLLVADLDGREARPILDRSAITRLGEGMETSLPSTFSGRSEPAQRLQEPAMRRTLDALEEFMHLARAQGAYAIAAVGTAALREAANRDEFLRRAQQRCGLDIEVLSGEEEARLTYLAVRRDALWRTAPRLIVLDIGGGSTEIIQGQPYSDAIAACFSLPLGAVRLTETYLRSDPPTITQLSAANEAAARAFAEIAFAPLPGVERWQIVGVGGTLANLGAVDLNGPSSLEALHGHLLTADVIESQVSLFASRTLQQRQRIPGLEPKRADIILGGALLLGQALAKLGSPAIAVSIRGLRWGVLFERFAF